MQPKFKFATVAFPVPSKEILMLMLVRTVRILKPYLACVPQAFSRMLLKGACELPWWIESQSKESACLFLQLICETGR